MLKFYQKKKTSQVLVWKQQKRKYLQTKTPYAKNNTGGLSSRKNYFLISSFSTGKAASCLYNLRL